MKIVLALLIAVTLAACGSHPGDIPAAVSATIDTSSSTTLGEVSKRAKSFLLPPNYEVLYSGDFGYSGQRLDIYYLKQPLLFAIEVPQSKTEYGVLVFDMTAVPDHERQQLISLIRLHLVPQLEQKHVVGHKTPIKFPARSLTTQSRGPP